MDWNDFAKRLTLELSRLPVQSFIIVQAPSGMPYVQAMRADQGMDAEAVGSAFLPRPLGHLQERRLRSLGWEPPDDQRRRNWWDHFDLRDPGRRDRDGRAAAERLEACAMLAGRMVGAFRDVYGVDSPLGLVYQAARIGKEGGPLALPGLGIPVAIPEGGERRTERPSGSALETALTDARERGDQRGYLELLARAPLYLPAPNNPGGTDHQYATAQFGDGTFILAFTSPEAMERSLQGQAVHHREESLARLARRWPNPRWQLAINPGLPSASYLDANALFEPEHAEPPRQARRTRKSGRRRAAPRETPVDPVPARGPQANGHTPPPSEDPPAPPTDAPAPAAAAGDPSSRGAAPRATLAGPPGERPAETAPSAPAPYPTGATEALGTQRPGAREPDARGSAPRDALAGLPGGRPGGTEAGVPTTYPAGPAEAPGAPRAGAGEPGARVGLGGGEDAHAGAPGAASAEDVAAGRQIVVMQKVVRSDHVQHYLEGGYDLVAGYVHRFEDVRGLGTPALLVRALGLVYEGSPFSPADEQVFVIRWAAVKPPLFRRPLGGIDEWSMGIVPGGWVIEKAPFPGSGYAPGEGPSIPEFKIDSQRLPHGAELYRLDAQGTERLVAVFDADLRRWHVKLPGGRA
ncbi:TY-Chap domain-containing protein [Actinomadura sp. LOL_011]|uniref:TY-Chap domain-containing protein n=1 Tax=Actinomadura sp. LOL_011 TaxID=3345410 RepID=UPI003A80D8DB